MRGSCVALVLVLAARPAAAEERRYEVGVGTAVPLGIGVEASLHPADRVVLDLALGWMPPPYLDLIHKPASYDDGVATFVDAALRHAVVVRVGAGYQPFPVPLSFHVGYTLASFGGGDVDGALFAERTGEDLRDDVGTRIPIRSTVHLVQLGAAYRLRLRRDLVLRFSVEYTQPVGAATRVEYTPLTDMERERLVRADAALDALMDDAFVSNTKTPVVGVSLRWRF